MTNPPTFESNGLDQIIYTCKECNSYDNIKIPKNEVSKGIWEGTVQSTAHFLSVKIGSFRTFLNPDIRSSGFCQLKITSLDFSFCQPTALSLSKGNYEN